MLPDYVTNITINNDKTKLESNDFYIGNYHVVVNCINDNLNAYFVVSKFNILDNNGAIHRLNHSKTNTQIEFLWEKNKPIEIYTSGNLNNTAYNIQLKIYSM